MLKISEGEQPGVLESVNRWFDTTVATRINDPVKGSFLGVCLRVAVNDITGHLLKRKGWEHLCLREEYEPDHRGMIMMPGFTWDADPRKEAGELLCPGRFGPKEIAEIKDGMTSREYAKLFQQRPYPAGGSRFKEDTFRDFFVRAQGVDDYLEFVCIEPGGATRVIDSRQCRYVGVLDPAGAEKRKDNRPCYSAMVMAYVTPEKDILIFDIYREQRSVPNLEDDIEKLYYAQKLNWIGIESSGIGLGVVQELNKRGVVIREIRAVLAKISDARSEAAELMLSNGKVYFLRGANWRSSFESELLAFPDGDYLDQADAFIHLCREIAGTKSRMSMVIEDVGGFAVSTV